MSQWRETRVELMLIPKNRTCLKKMFFYECNISLSERSVCVCVHVITQVITMLLTCFQLEKVFSYA